jgi:hypothetical protein
LQRDRCLCVQDRLCKSKSCSLTPSTRQETIHGARRVTIGDERAPGHRSARRCSPDSDDAPMSWGTFAPLPSLRRAAPRAVNRAAACGPPSGIDRAARRPGGSRVLGAMPCAPHAVLESHDRHAHVRRPPKKGVVGCPAGRAACSFVRLSMRHRHGKEGCLSASCEARSVCFRCLPNRARDPRPVEAAAAAQRRPRILWPASVCTLRFAVHAQGQAGFGLCYLETLILQTGFLRGRGRPPWASRAKPLEGGAARAGGDQGWRRCGRGAGRALLRTLQPPSHASPGGREPLRAPRDSAP